jgi:hypothetical protein
MNAEAAAREIENPKAKAARGADDRNSANDRDIVLRLKAGTTRLLFAEVYYQKDNTWELPKL